MRRIELDVEKVVSLPPSALIDHAVVRQSRQRGFSYSMFAPLHYEPNYDYPLVLWLHGPDDNENQLKRVMPLISMRNYAAIAPRGVIVALNDPEGGRRCTWRQSEREIDLALRHILACVDVARSEYNINTSRIFLAGYDTGGTMAMRVGFCRPELFAGIASLGGPFPEGRTPLAQLNCARNIPLLISYGKESVRYPVDQVCDDLRLLHAAGMSVSLRQYPCGDEVTTTMLSDLDAWIMGVINGEKTLA